MCSNQILLNLGSLLKSAGCFLPGYKGCSSQESLRLLLEPFGHHHHHHLSDVGNILQARVLSKVASEGLNSGV